MAREEVRISIQDSGIFVRWCQLALSFIQSRDIHPYVKTDYLNFLTNAWKLYPELFEQTPHSEDTVLKCLYENV
jgi:hypothetical protein